MSTLSIWIIGLICYLVGLAIGVLSGKDEDARGIAFVTALLGAVLILILVGAKLGGAQ